MLVQHFSLQALFCLVCSQLFTLQSLNYLTIKIEIDQVDLFKQEYDLMFLMMGNYSELYINFYFIPDCLSCMKKNPPFGILVS